MCCGPEKRARLREVRKLREASRLTCTACGISVAADYPGGLHQEGWRVIDGKVRCPGCHGKADGEE